MNIPRWLACLLCVIAPVEAQPVPTPLRISQSITIAFQRNPSLAVAQADVLQAQAIYEQAGSLPSGAITAGLSRGEGPASLNSFSGLRRDEYVQFEQSFQPFGLMKKAQFVAWLNLQETTARLQLVRNSLMHDTKDAFYTLLAAQERIKTYQANLTLAKQIFEVAEKHAGPKRKARLELLAARVQRNQVEQALTQTAGELQSAQADLAPLLGLDSGAQLQVEGELHTDCGYLQLADMLMLGEKSPALEAARQATLSSHEQVKLSALQGNPSPSLLAVYDFRIPSYILGAQLSIPLDWGQIGYDVQAKSAAAMGQEARFRALVLGISADIHKAYAAFMAAEKNSARYEKEVLHPQEESVRLLQDEFAQHQADYAHVLGSQQQLEDIRIEYLRQRLNERLALNALELAVGSPIEKLSPEPEGLWPGNGP